MFKLPACFGKELQQQGPKDVSIAEPRLLHLEHNSWLMSATFCQSTGEPSRPTRWRARNHMISCVQISNRKYIVAHINITHILPCFLESAAHQGMRQALQDLMIQSWLCVTTVSFWYPSSHWLMHVAPCEHTYPQLSSAKSARWKPVKLDTCMTPYFILWKPLA